MPEALSVLLVEDHAMVAEALVAALEAEDDIVVAGWAGSLADAVALADGLADPPDVVLMDFRLPDGDAADGVRRFRERFPGVRILVLSAWSDHHSLARAVEAGCDGYLLKQQPVAELLDGLRRVQAGGAVFAPEVLPKVLALLPGRQAGPVGGLTAREVDVLALLATGATTSEIADSLGVRVNTVRNHVQNVLVKLGAHSRLEAVALATRDGLLPSA